MTSRIASVVVKKVAMNQSDDLSKNSFEAARMFVHEFETGDVSRRFLFGTNRYAKALADTYNFAGVIDEYSSESYWNGLPIIALSQLPVGAMVVCAATGRPKLAMQKLAACPVWSIDFFSFRKMRPHGLPDIRFNEDFKSEFRKNNDNFKKIYTLLEDLESKKIFSKLIDFRLNQNLFEISDFQEKTEKQYFDECITLTNHEETFFDVGGFEGETTIAFYERAGSGSKAYVFEPEEQNFARCSTNLSHIANAVIHRIALSDQTTIGSITGQGSNARVEAGIGDGLVFRKLDEFAHCDPTFIKVDVEGHELNVLAGASSVLSTAAPKLAIATYHQPSHFWRIPDFVLGVQPRYKLYLRHYTESIYESVFYFVPK